MPCSCGNTTCPCGIPCYCSEASCKCHACAIALRRSCKICNKPLITDIQTEMDTCSCFVGESTALILENQYNPQWRLGNIPMPVSYFMCGKLIVNVTIPVLSFPQFIPLRPIHWIGPPSLQADSKNISTSQIPEEDVVTPLGLKESGISSTAELNQAIEKSNAYLNSGASSGIFSTDAQNVETPCKETFPPLFLQSTDGRRSANVVQQTMMETDGHGIVQEPSSFYLPSIRIGNVSYPVELADPVWRLPNPAFCFAGGSNSSLMIYNPFHATGPNHTQTVSTFEKECPQSALGVNFDSNGLEHADNVTTFQTNEQPLDPTKIIKQSDLKIYGQGPEYVPFCSGNELTTFPLTRNSKAINLTEEWKQPACRNLQSNNNLMLYLKSTVSNDTSSSGVQELSGLQSQTVCAVSTDISSFSAQGLFGVQSQPECAVSISEPKKNDFSQACNVGSSGGKAISNGEMWQQINYSDEINSETDNISEYFGASNSTSKLEWLFKKGNIQNTEENKYSQSGNMENEPIPLTQNSEENKYSLSGNMENDPIALYLDSQTTRKMEKLLKLAKN